MSALSVNAAAIYDRINAATSPSALDELSVAIWKIYWPGIISDADAQYLSEAIQKRKPSRASISSRPISALQGRVSSRFAPRPCRRRLTTEEHAKRRERKRMLGGSSAMPDTMRRHYTEGERAVGCVVAGEVKRVGICELSIDEIADRAGVGRTTVQNWQHEARRLGHVCVRHRPQRGAKSLTNVITIICTDWLTWIKRAPSAARVQTSKNVNTTKNIDIKTNTDSIKAAASVRREAAFRGSTRCISPPCHGAPVREDREMPSDPYHDRLIGAD
jgi:hypothetical protein